MRESTHCDSVVRDPSGYQTTRTNTTILPTNSSILASLELSHSFSDITPYPPDPRPCDHPAATKAQCHYDSLKESFSAVLKVWMKLLEGT
jgi:hypothetical protein